MSPQPPPSANPAELDIPAPPASLPEAASLDSVDDASGAKVVSGPTAEKTPRMAWLALACVCLFWGTSSPVIRYTVQFVHPLTLVALRFFIAGSLLWVVLWLLGRRPPTRGLSKIVLSGLVLAFTNVLVTLGFKRVEAGTGTLLLATTAVAFAVVDLAWPGGTKRLSPSVWLGLVLGMVGVAVLGFSPQSLGSGQWQGYLMLTLSSWVWAIGGVAQARHPSGQDPIQSSAWQMLIASAAVSLVAAARGEMQLGSIGANGWLGILVLVLTASIIGFVAFVYMMRKLPAYIAGSYPFVNAIVAATIGVLWLGEQLSARFYVAAVLVLGGVALIQRLPRRDASVSPE